MKMNTFTTTIFYYILRTPIILSQYNHNTGLHMFYLLELDRIIKKKARKSSFLACGKWKPVFLAEQYSEGATANKPALSEEDLQSLPHCCSITCIVCRSSCFPNNAVPKVIPLWNLFCLFPPSFWILGLRRLSVEKDESVVKEMLSLASMSKRFCSDCCSTFPQRVKGYFQANGFELKMLLSFAGPLAITNLMDFAPFVITAMFVGHIGKLQLDAIMLAVAYTSVFGVAVGLGLNAACDTLLSQIYGGKNLKYIGVVVQRAILILSLACFPCWAFYINTENLLLLCGQDKDLARETELCVLVLIPALPAFFFCQLELRYLQNQEIMWPQILVSLMANVVNALVNYLMLFILEIGVMGAALGITLGTIFEFIMLFIYIRVKKLHVASWQGWSAECLKDWWSFLALGIPGLLIMSIEFWAYEIAMILTGLINLVELGGQSILYQLMSLVQKIPFSIAMAASIRVGIFLGAGETDQAKRSAKLSMVIAALFVLLVFTLLLALKKPLGEMFTNDKAIILLVSQTMPLCVFYHAVSSPAGVFNGLLRGIGKPEIGAFACVTGYCLIVFPIGVPLMFSLKLGIKGFWTGMIVGFVCINLFFCIYFWRLNWNLVTEKAQELVGLKKGLASFGQSADPASFEHSIDTPDEIELVNYASLHSSSEMELEQKETPEVSQEDRKALKWLIIRRSLEALAVISTLFIGLIIKLTIKQH